MPSLNVFIRCLAREIATLYPDNYVDEKDYIQEGHLKLAEIRGDEYQKRDFKAYAIIAVARAMRKMALETMCSISAPCRIKKQVCDVEILLRDSKTNKDICEELGISTETLAMLRSLIKTESWQCLFEKPTYDPEPFSVVDDILGISGLTEEDKIFLKAQAEGNGKDLGFTRKQRWSQVKKIRPKLMRSGYGN